MQLVSLTGATIEVTDEAASRYMACGFRPIKKAQPKEEEPKQAPSKKKSPKAKK